MTIDATDLLRQAETYLAITHEQAARHDILGAAFSCSGCELRKRIAALLAQPAAAPSVPADADQRTEIRDTVDRLRGERDQARKDLSASHDDLTDALGADPDAEWTDLIRLAARQRARVAELSIRAVQTDAWDNKLAKGFNTTDVPFEFGLLNAEVSEAFTAWRKSLPDFGEELADVFLYLAGLAEMTGIDLQTEVERKLAINAGRVYERNGNGALIKAGEA